MSAEEAKAPERGSRERIRVPHRLYAGYVFDLDGTIYLGSELLPGAERLVLALRDMDRKVVFVSNNPTRDPEEYARKLTDLGLSTAASDVINTVVTTTTWLVENAPDATVFPVSEEPLKRALRERGIRMSEDPGEIDIVIASYDRQFEYRKLQIAFDAIRGPRRARLIATNPDRFCPFPDGHGEPDAAAITAAIEACTETGCELHFGKPGPVMLQAIANALDLRPEDCVLTGDRLTTDIRAAQDASMAAALVLTGETKAEAVSQIRGDQQPEYVLDRIDRLMPRDQWEELGWRVEDDGSRR
ncbi:MAG: HAD-IIA family hydrolase [Solirubrobacterales bacterium]|nr:HAD-IIA family hydrolase [Solirubrobacterales bacterium]